ncbi:TSUP family transporter [Devosia sp. L53-10-65]|uniref:Probable membrane transporter protein n=2 Tax=Devosia marina TaxID=2683198 RepID=A0A7X3FS83_9HYPH|nr:sulfite exporter TauE/SafE family protein [Devosia marina]MVS98955.1 TSUP family transporter [Devosia marina]
MAVTGLVAGFVAGLLGVGGGIVIVPVLDIALGAFNVDPSIRMKVAVATSLATIMATSLASARAHHRAGAVDLALLKSWGPMIFVGVVLGTIIAGMVDGQVLSVVFATTALIVSANMVLRAKSHKLFDDFPNGVVKSALGILVGTISAMMGIGGGTLGVPILTIFGTDIRRAVGTASAIGFIIAIPGTIGYVITGWDVAGLPPFSLGYVNLVAVTAIIPLSMLAAPWGARTAHTIPREALAYGFGAFLTLTAIKMYAGLLIGI